jgi:subtilisin family serine protease
MSKQYGWVTFVTLIGMLFFLARGAAPASATVLVRPAPADPITPSLHQEMAGLPSDTHLRVIVTLTTQPNYADIENTAKGLPFSRRQQVVENRLRSDSLPSQANFRSRLDALRNAGKVSSFLPFWIFNGFSLDAAPAVIQELASRPDVLSITSDQTQVAITPLARVAPAAVTSNANITLLNAPSLWALGFTGQGVVVANLDTGVDGAHPDLASRYRGGANSWYDPYGQDTSPTDNAGTGTGHGTATMSLMVGGNLSGNDIGMAPGAKWIAAKIFDNSGSATATAIHQAFQWVLDPDGNPATADAPQVVSDSWGNVSPGCDLTFQPDLQALLAAGILPVFSAGNSGPSASTGTSPGNLPEAFPVGAIDNASNIASFSSRGPSSCGRSSSAAFPLVVAPGVSIPVAAPGGTYTTLSGTSFSSPETAGALALLLSAFPGLTPAAQATALTGTAFDLGTAGLDNNFGYGRVDALAAYQRLKANAPTATPTPKPVLNANNKIYLPVTNR